jgi:hypothetical protein
MTPIRACEAAHGLPPPWNCLALLWRPRAAGIEKSRSGDHRTGLFRNCRRRSRFRCKTLKLGGAATSNQKAATPNRAVRMAGGVASTNPHDCEDDRIPRAIGNAIRSLT